ncbi:Spore coat polysaccharide biosynthesis protein spsB [Halobacillus sp. BAB-2008]|uniref:Spore coat polysaccharide biosynthesis protein spsB n=1 Tax=Halobacillus sp. BAB-2008 TaxID=1246484 RepID=UPI0002A4F85E|nr:Spore coat polysaccharide biosynthesis protein spsB [Halobacillus sp. BAB-2008]ELK46600.1 Spore coat polysaccharide biosynthesis protein spsB [Halobacillus sp. BAB-2008]
MNDYERDYWSSYFDFLDKFKALKFMGIPVALVLPYYVLIMDRGLDKLGTPAAGRRWSVPLAKEEELQSRFEQVLKPYKKRNTKRKGKIVFYDAVLRIPQYLLRSSFSPAETLILRQKQSVNPYTAYKTKYFYSLQQVDKETKKSFIKEWNSTMDQYVDHPIYGNVHFRKKVRMLLPSALMQIAAAAKFFETTEVSCLIVGTTNSSDSRSLVLAASQRGIPTICLQHGIPMLEFGYLPKVATFQAVYGERDKRWYESRGVPSITLRMIGHPRMDDIYKRKGMSREAFCHRLSLNKKRKTILLVLHHEEMEMVDSILSELQKNAVYNIVVKRRNGRQRKSEATLALAKKYKKLTYVDDLPLHDVLRHVDAVISYDSTIVLEAMLAGKVVLLWSLNSLSRSSTNYYDSLEYYRFEKPEELVEALCLLLEDGSYKQGYHAVREKTIASLYQNRSGTSTKVLAELVRSLIL